jgi:hypothetical protein
MGAFKTFDLEIRRQIRKRGLGLPSRSTASVFRLHNHQYEHIRTSWRGARKALKYEYRLLRRLEQAADLEAELVLVSDETYEEDCPPLRGLDLGVAATVLTLAAMGCFTVTSCNGGCFGSQHHEEHPLVVFYAKPDDAETLLRAAEETGVGITNGDCDLMVWANNIWNMHNFAKAIFRLRWKLRRVRREKVEPC